MQAITPAGNLKNQMDIANAIKEAIQHGCRFASFTYTSKTAGETSRYVVLLGLSYNNIVKKSLLKLMQSQASFSHREACEAVKASLEKTLAAHAINQQNENYTKKGLYKDIKGTNGSVKINSNDNSIQLMGIVISKKVLIEGEYKKVNSRPLTIEKRKIQKTLPVSKWREFAFENLSTVKANGKTMELA